MSGYRNRTSKATAALWLLVVVADAAWAVTSGTAALLGTLALVTVGALLVLFAIASNVFPAFVRWSVERISRGPAERPDFVADQPLTCAGRSSQIGQTHRLAANCRRLSMNSRCLSP